MNREQFKEAFGKLVAKIWVDSDLKARLHTEPLAVFKENGIEMPPKAARKIVENPDKIDSYITAAELFARIGKVDDDINMFMN